MSLIEAALAKLRGGAEAGAAANANGEAARQSAKSVRVVSRPPRDYLLKRITLDLKALRAAGYLPEEGLERCFADDYRQIKRPLIDRALSGGETLRTILVTSALPGDGKTFTSINLALNMARERDFSVLLVDADAPRRSISEVLGIRGEPGLLDALADESLDVESAIIQTDIVGLEVLPAGKFADGAPELMASARMELITSRLAARNAQQLILFDSAPLLVSSEARALQRVLGQVVLVVRVGQTPLHAALEAAGCVDREKLQGLILNDATNIGRGYYGYSYYGDGNLDGFQRPR